MKKIVLNIHCFILILLFCILIFSGCSRAGTEETSNTSEGVTSIQPPSIEIIGKEGNGFVIAEGTDIVTAVKNNSSNTITMMVASDTDLKVFKEAVKAEDGFYYNIIDINGNEITADSVIIEDGYKFVLYKSGETEAAETYIISVVEKEKIESTVSEAKAEQSRYESQLAEQSSKQSFEQTSVSESAPQSSNPDFASEARSNTDISSAGASYVSSAAESLLNGGTFTIETGSGIILSESWYKKFKEIEDKYGININIKESSEGQLIPEHEYEDLGDLIIISLSDALKMAKKNSLEDFKKSSNINLNASYFNTAVSNAFTFKDKTYAVSLSSMSEEPAGVIFNSDLISLYAPEYDIYQMYKEGTWTVDAYMELMRKCSKNLDSNPSTYEVYGMTSDLNVIGEALGSFAGGMVNKDTSTGYIYPCFVNDAGIMSLEWCKNAYRNNYWKYMPDIYEGINFFAARNTATLVTYSWAIKQAALSADFKMGFVSFPKSVKQNDYINMPEDELTVFAVYANKFISIDKACAFINLLAESNDEFIDTRVNEYKNSGLDEIGCGIYRKGLTNQIPDFSSGVFSPAIWTDIFTSVTNSSKEPASAMVAIRDQAVAETDEYYGILTGQPQ